MMIAGLEFAAATALLLSAQDSVRCDLFFHGAAIETRGPERISVRCPDGDPVAQDAAEASVGALDLNFGRRANIHGFAYAETLELVAREEGGWRAAPGQILIEPQIAFPMAAARRTATHMVCALALSPDETGAPQDVEAECLSDIRSVETILSRAALSAYAESRLAPSDLPYCMDHQFYVRAAIFNRNAARIQEPRPIPDPEGLPNMCDTRLSGFAAEVNR